MSDAPERIWAFDRYVNGVLMAEGVEITRAASFEDACVSAARLASRGPNGEAPVLILATPAALAASPEVQALIAAEGDRAARICEALMRKGVSPEKWPDYFRVRSAGDTLLNAALRNNPEASLPGPTLSGRDGSPSSLDLSRPTLRKDEEN